MAYFYCCATAVWSPFVLLYMAWWLEVVLATDLARIACWPHPYHSKLHTWPLLDPFSRMHETQVKRRDRLVVCLKGKCYFNAFNVTLNLLSESYMNLNGLLLLWKVYHCIVWLTLSNRWTGVKFYLPLKFNVRSCSTWCRKVFISYIVSMPVP